MKSLSAIFISPVVFGCFLGGILGGPQPSIDRTVTDGELVGTWTVTTESAARQGVFIAQNPDWGAEDPFRAMTLNRDGTCKVNIDSTWLAVQGTSVLHTAKARQEDSLPCLWKQTNVWGAENRTYPGISIEVGVAGPDQDEYRLFITEAKSGLTLWNFIGDPDDLVTLDYRESQP